MAHLNTAWLLGAQQAHAEFNKYANESLGTQASIAGLGAIPAAGPALAGIAGRYASPEGESEIRGPAIASSSLRGQLLGGLGGAALGSGGLALAKEYGLDTKMKPSTAALLGGLLGTGVGGALGANLGQRSGGQFVDELEQAIANRDASQHYTSLYPYEY